MATAMKHIEELSVNTIRTLAMDAVQKANSGHPGTPMALAPVAYVLYNEVMRYDPEHPVWPARDRFVLSCGHASMLLYATLHLAGVKQLGGDGQPTGELACPIEHIRNFRQLHSRCPGHPECGETSGVETTTGPLGQGIGNSVGMALASRWFAARYDEPDYDLFGYRVYALCSDGDLMEGMSGEAASIAGHLGLSNLCWLYDDNHITIEGDTALSFSEEVADRFHGYGWHVLKVGDVNDLDELRQAIYAAQQFADRPTLIMMRSTIAWGAPKAQGTHAAHGAPLGEEEIRATKKAYGWPADEHFRVPDEVRAHFAEGIGERGRQACGAWHARFDEYARKFPAKAAELRMLWKGELPVGWASAIQPFPPSVKGTATRNSSGKVLNQVASQIPWMIGGSADLAPSNKTRLTFAEATSISRGNHGGRNIHFGIRELAMAAIGNGLALSGLRPFVSTFFVFSDYLRPAMRLSALMKLPVMYVLTHDSIGVGEDGPTHQPVEHLAACRAIPNLLVFRPGDANEVAEAYRMATKIADQPSAMIVSRQDLPTLDREKYAPAYGVELGGYVLADPPVGEPQAILIGTGSELSLCVAAYEQLTEEGIRVRVVSLPCWELFDAQPPEYRNTVLPPHITCRVGVEAGIRQGWDRYIGDRGRFVGMPGFGASAPAELLFEHFGITTGRVVAEVKELLAGA